MTYSKVISVLAVSLDLLRDKLLEQGFDVDGGEESLKVTTKQKNTLFDHIVLTPHPKGVLLVMTFNVKSSFIFPLIFFIGLVLPTSVMLFFMMNEPYYYCLADEPLPHPQYAATCEWMERFYLDRLISYDDSDIAFAENFKGNKLGLLFFLSGLSYNFAFVIYSFFLITRWKRLMRESVA